MIDNNKITVIISIPLLAAKGQFEIYQVINMPFVMLPGEKKRSVEMNMLPSYDLDVDAIAINAGCTTYSLLTERDLKV